MTIPALAFSAIAALHCAGGETVSSPDGAIDLGVCVDEGVPRYAVRAHGFQVLGPSRLGLSFQGGLELDRDFALVDTTRDQHQETWEQVWGESRTVNNAYNELRLHLRQTTPSALAMTLVFRAFDDGVAFRYEVPPQPGLEDFVMTAERTEFAFADHRAWWIPAFQKDRYEQRYRHTPLSEIEFAHTPLTIEGEGGFYAVHEAALVDYASMTLKGGDGGLLKAELVPWADGAKVKGRAPITSPWRTIQIGRRAVDLLASAMILNLNEPNRLADTSWIRPQKYLGIWWALHIGRLTWGPGPTHGATTENAKRYIDSAAGLGIPAVLIEGWNLGWDRPWGPYFDFVTPTPDFDLRDVAAYARDRGVELVGHHETAGAIANYESQVDAALALYRELGVRVVKSGYVGDRVEGGEWHHGQFMVRHHQLMAEKAAAYGIMLDIHEPIKDTGLRRTYPNLMTREGARGAEWDAWDEGGGNPPSHTTILPFTRMLAGPFDYTPGIFDLLASGRPGVSRPRTTLAKQLALYVVIYSPLQMAADLPENYAGHPAFQFIRDVAVDWEETRPLDGVIGEYVTIARRKRGSDEWFLGSITAEAGRRLEIGLGFLAVDRSYCAEIYRDAADAHFESRPLAYAIEHRAVRWDTILTLDLAPGGGQAIRFVPDSDCH